MRLDADKDKDEENKNRKLVNLIEKYKAELNETHIEIRDLKSRLSEASDLQVIKIFISPLLESFPS